MEAEKTDSKKSKKISWIKWMIYAAIALVIAFGVWMFVEIKKVINGLNITKTTDPTVMTMGNSGLQIVTGLSITNVGSSSLTLNSLKGTLTEADGTLVGNFTNPLTTTIAAGQTTVIPITINIPSAKAIPTAPPKMTGVLSFSYGLASPSASFVINL